MPTIITKTVKPSGGDYTSLSAWEAGEQADLVTLDEIRQAECYAMQDTTAVTIDGWTTDATRYVRVYTPASERHDGKWNSSKYRLEITNGNGISCKERYVRIEGVQIHLNRTYSSGSYGIDFQTLDTWASTAEIRIDNCIIRANGNVSSSGRGILFGTTSGVFSFVVKIKNTIIYQQTNKNMYGIMMSDNDWTVHAHNVTVVDCGTGLYQSAGTFNAKNCGISGCTTPITGTVNQTTCSTSTPTFVDAANEDYHLASSDTTWKDQGTDLSGDANYAFTDDIDSATRSGTWDIGADEYTSGGSTYNESLSLGISNGLTDSAILTMSEAVAMALGLASSWTGALNMDGAVSLAAALGDSQAHTLTISEAVSMAVGLGMTDNSTLDAVAGLTLAFNGSFTVDPAGSTYTVSTTLGALMAVSLAYTGTFWESLDQFSKVVREDFKAKIAHVKSTPVKVVINPGATGKVIKH